MKWGITLALCLLSGAALAQDADRKDAQKPAEMQPSAPRDEAKKPEAPTIIRIEKSNKPDPCIIKPVMTDKDLRDCGAKPPQTKPAP